MDSRCPNTPLTPSDGCGYESPAAPPRVPSFSEAWGWEAHGTSGGLVARCLLGAEARLTGFSAFLRRLPHSLEDRLRSRSWRPVVPGPLDSATMVLADDPAASDGPSRAASLILACRDLEAAISSGGLPSDRHATGPLEMGQYFNLFSTHLDILGGGPNVRARARERITVASRGALFLLSLPRGAPPDAIADALTAVDARSSAVAPDGRSGPLLGGCLRHTQLALLRRSSPRTRVAIRVLEDSFLTVCLDLDSRPATIEEAGRLAQIGNYGNRWYPSALQLVVFGNGKAAVLCSFGANIDGNTMMRAASEIQRRALCHRVVRAAEPGRAGAAPVRASRLRVSLDGDAARRVRGQLAALTSLDDSVFCLEGAGRALFDDTAVPAVTAFVIALHAAAARTIGAPCDVFQFLSQSRYAGMGVRTLFTTTRLMARTAMLLWMAPAEQRQLGRRLAMAAEEYARRCGAARRHLALDLARQMFLASLDAPTARQVDTVGAFVDRTMDIVRCRRKPVFTIVASHPDPYDNVDLVGRPGVQPPEGRVGLHYQMRAADTRMVFCAASGFPTRKFVAATEAALRIIGRSAPRRSRGG